MKINCLTLVFAGLLSLFPIKTPAFCASVYVSGKVLIAETKAPAADATLSLYKLDDADTPVSVNQTLVNGSFLLKAPAPGKYRLTVAGSLFTAIDKTMDIPAKGLSAQVIQVNHLPFIGIQLQSPDGKPFHGGSADFWLLLSWQDGFANNNVPPGGGPFGMGGPGMGAPMEWTQPVGPDGKVEITPTSGDPGGPRGRMQLWLPDGSLQGISGVTVRVRIPGQGCGQLQFDHWPRQVASLHLQAGATLQGLALDYNGKPLANATVSVAPALGVERRRFRQVDHSIIAGPDGRFQVGTLIPGQYLVRAHGPDGSPSVNRVDVKAPTTAVTLRPGGFSVGIMATR